MKPARHWGSPRSCWRCHEVVAEGAPRCLHCDSSLYPITWAGTLLGKILLWIGMLVGAMAYVGGCAVGVG